MQITVFGAAGKVGQQVVRLLLADGYTVVAFIHHNNPYTQEQSVRTVKGSVEDSTAVQRAITGSTAVIIALGSWGTPSKDIVSNGTTTVIEAMNKVGGRRLIAVTGAGAWCSADRPSFLDRCNHALLKLVAPKILADGEAHLRALEASKLDWTSIRSPIMTNSKSEQFVLQAKLPSLIATIPRAAVARCLVDQLKESQYINQAAVISHV